MLIKKPKQSYSSSKYLEYKLTIECKLNINKISFKKYKNFKKYNIIIKYILKQKYDITILYQIYSLSIYFLKILLKI